MGPVAPVGPPGDHDALADPATVWQRESSLLQLGDTTEHLLLEAGDVAAAGIPGA
jgi:hypothetical protein